jgi:hypothetical protein
LVEAVLLLSEDDEELFESDEDDEPFESDFVSDVDDGADVSEDDEEDEDDDDLPFPERESVL